MFFTQPRQEQMWQRHKILQAVMILLVNYRLFTGRTIWKSDFCGCQQKKATEHVSKWEPWQRPPKPFASRQQNLAFWTKETSAFWYLIMFKLESYITPIILSYVEKYVKDVKAERSQVRFSFKYFFEVSWKYLVESVERIAIQEVQ